MKKDIKELFCLIEDFCRAIDENFANKLLPSSKKPTRIPEITTAEIRPLAEPVYDEKFLGESQMSTAEYLNVFEERNQVSTTKLPSETELCKRSNVSLWIH